MDSNSHLKKLEVLVVRICKLLFITCTNLSQESATAESLMQHGRYFNSVWSGTSSNSVTAIGDRFVSDPEIHSYFILIPVHFAIQGRVCYVGAKCTKLRIECMKNIHLSWVFVWFRRWSQLSGFEYLIFSDVFVFGYFYFKASMKTLRSCRWKSEGKNCR